MALPLVCPAAVEITPPAHGPSVLCGVLHLANQREQVGNSVSPVMSGRRDRSVVRYACAGQGIPGSPASYCACVIWRAERDAAIEGRRDGLRDEQAVRVRGGADERVADAVTALQA